MDGPWHRKLSPASLQGRASIVSLFEGCWGSMGSHLSAQQRRYVGGRRLSGIERGAQVGDRGRRVFLHCGEEPSSPLTRPWGADHDGAVLEVARRRKETTNFGQLEATLLGLVDWEVVWPILAKGPPSPASPTALRGTTQNFAFFSFSRPYMPSLEGENKHILNQKTTKILREDPQREAKGTLRAPPPFGAFGRP